VSVGESFTSAGAIVYHRVSPNAEVTLEMKFRSVLVVLVLLVVCSVGARAQEAGEGQNLPRITLDEFKQLLAQNAITVLDVRNGEIAAKIKGAAHIAETDLQARLKELPHDREIVTYCA
jgi:Rhodanese-like domain